MNRCKTTNSQLNCLFFSGNIWFGLQRHRSNGKINLIKFFYLQYICVFSKIIFICRHRRFRAKENRIRGEFTRKKCKTAILLYCFHTASVLHIFMLYNLLGPGIAFYKNLKLILKENQIMK